MTLRPTYVHSDELRHWRADVPHVPLIVRLSQLTHVFNPVPGVTRKQVLRKIKCRTPKIQVISSGLRARWQLLRLFPL